MGLSLLHRVGANLLLVMKKEGQSEGKKTQGTASGPQSLTRQERGNKTG
jgi:hypothetical protein